ncbi:MAG: ABC transporter permease, partial [Cytophagales bacterium]
MINVVGLSIGIAVFILILQFVSFEQSINKFHTNLASIHRVMFEAKNGQVYEYSAPVIGQTAKQNFPEVLNYCRVVDQSFVGGVVAVPDKS